nr:unnamed protein product [Callosobruchus chinensis]
MHPRNFFFSPQGGRSSYIKNQTISLLTYPSLSSRGALVFRPCLRGLLGYKRKNICHCDASGYQRQTILGSRISKPERVREVGPKTGLSFTPKKGSSEGSVVINE